LPWNQRFMRSSAPRALPPSERRGVPPKGLSRA